MLTKIKKWGNSQGIQFAKTILESAQINVGDEVDVSVAKGEIIVKPVSRIRGKYHLRELVAKMPKDSLHEELDWGNPVGKEIG